MQNEKIVGHPTSAVLVKVIKGQAQEIEKRFTDTFLIGRGKDCNLQIRDSCISRNHVQIIYDGERWQVKDIGSANGTYVNGIRIQEVPLDEKMELELGKGGPVISLILEKVKIQEKEKPQETKGFPSETQIIQHYFTKSQPEKVGEQTMMFRRAFERAHKKRARKYWIIIGVSLLLLIASGSIIAYQKNRLNKLRNTAQNIFYDMKSMELQISGLEDIVLSNKDTYQANELRTKRQKLKEMEKNYDNFVKELGVYNKLREEERSIYRMARLFGECEINMPEGFVKEVWNYINRWKSTDRLKEGIYRAKLKGYTPLIVKALNENNLPPQFFYLALQESNFDDRAVGPLTRYGYAKGIWQFIPMTANLYNLRVGPLFEKAVYDPQDERFNFEKSTNAAARYLKDINNTEAQASGLLVMASYNWGEDKIKQIIDQMPENPRERNFWRLIAKKNIPQETYDYVFYIFSATVICENPRLFGFDFDCPTLSISD